MLYFVAKCQVKKRAKISIRLLLQYHAKYILIWLHQMHPGFYLVNYKQC